MGVPNIRTKIMSVAFDNVTLTEAVDYALQCVQNQKKCVVVTPNAEIAQMCKNDNKLCKIVEKAGLVLPDGIGVVLASKILKTPLKQKVAGVEFGDVLLNKMQNTGKSIYFFGGKPGVAEAAAQKMQVKYTGLKIAGFRDGYFKSDEEAISEINAAKPDVLYVCLGAPKQEFFMDKYCSELNCTVMAGLGGSLDVMAGVTKRAPKIFISLGLEWLYRLLCQPSRIGRMMKLPLYLLNAVAARLKGDK